MPSVFALVDCNNFFVSCERVFRPDLWHKPVAVLSNNDGCIVARSNEVKALGVPMGIPYFKVRDVLEKNGVMLFSGNFPLYGDFSQRIVHILNQACPDVEVYSVDESFLELSTLNITDYETWGRELKAKIYQWTGIPVSIGIAPSKTLAKAAADFAKKNEDCEGVFSMIPDDHLSEDDAAELHGAMLKQMPVGTVWGVGWRTAPKVQALGVGTAYDLSKVSDNWALKQLTIRGLKTVRELRGESCIALEQADEQQKSIMYTRSFGHSVRNYHELEAAVATFAARASAKLRSKNELAGAVLTFLRSSKHAEIKGGGSRLIKLLPPSADTGQIISTALACLKEIHDQDLAYKKAGVVLLDLRSADAWQLALASDPKQLQRSAQLMQTVDEINTKFGTRLIRHASERPELTGWHSLRQKRSGAFTTSWTELVTVKA